MHKVQEHLKGYSHVNKKAFEQYQTFTKDRDALLTRRDELDASGDSIQELIETLDARKDEAIERTFKQVSKNFAEIFEKLVPAGRGKLRMLKRLEGDVSAVTRVCFLADLFAASRESESGGQGHGDR